MSRRPWLVVLIAAFVGSAVLLTAVLVPQQLNLAYQVALDFVYHAARAEDGQASALLGDELRAYVAQNCRDGLVSACIDDYLPDEWGGFVSAVFRRAQPDGPHAWDVQLIATYAEGQGFSGVCIYARAEKDSASSGAQASDWRITRWSGWASCDDPNTRLGQLVGPDAPNRAP
ncbi:MAG: hypothetical protein NZ750_06065 [Anaerolineae bacterium]|nr:hypothetical protein [Anaerolineae bacterium]MDW8173013.1 hypothetical protein [Anaerolineae bacterium]